MRRISYIMASVCICGMISLSIVVWNFDTIKEGYEIIVVFPFVYLVCFLMGWERLCYTNYKFTYYLFYGIEFIRFVVTPIFIALAGDECDNGYLPVAASDIRGASLLMVIELVLSAFFIVFIFRESFDASNEETQYLRGTNLGYLGYILVSVFVFIYYLSHGTKLFYFISIPVGDGTRIGDITETNIVLARQIVLLGFVYAFIIILNWARDKYSNLLLSRYYYVTLIVAIINVCVIVGERRSAQIYSAVCCGYLLIEAFPYKKKSTIRIVCITAVCILAVMSLYKFSAAFLYDTYADAFKASSFDVGEISRILQSYFAGPHNVGLAINISKSLDLNAFHWIFDILRSTVPISFLFKGSGTLTSVLFNNYIYNGAQSSGHVLSSTGYGFIYGDVFLAPFMMLVNVTFSRACEKKMKTSKSYEMRYIWLYITLRFALNLQANLPALLSAASIMLFTGTIVVVVSSVFGRRDV